MSSPSEAPVAAGLSSIATQSQACRSVSVIIPARNEVSAIAKCIAAVKAQADDTIDLEVIVVDDGSDDGTADAATVAGATVLRRESGREKGSPAAARNRGAEMSKGAVLVFLDADCVPGPGWLNALLSAHEAGASVVGGSLDLPPGLPPTARCDYYCGWYLVHSGRPPGPVPHHPPPNLSVLRSAFFSTGGFTERAPFEYTNEERAWQGELRRAGHRIVFEPRAVAYHYNRAGLGNLLRRQYRWAYTAIESKHRTGAARAAWLYRYPRLAIAASLPLALAHGAFIIGCWVRAGIYEPLFMLPMVFLSRLAYAAGMAVGGYRWLRQDPEAETGGPRWR